MSINFDLTGHWTFHEQGSEESLPANVPGCVHTDLLDLHKIPNPWYRNNEVEIQWVWKKEWVYEREFDLEASFLELPYVHLRSLGLDTLATVEINSHVVLRANNMHRTWDVDVKPQLITGRNHIRITFHSPAEMMTAKFEEHDLPAWNLFHSDFAGKNYLRKMACAFGWDWGLMAPTVGIWRPISLVAFESRIDRVTIKQAHSSGSVSLHVNGKIEGEADRIDFSILAPMDKSADSTSVDVDPHGGFSLSFDVKDPQLWWPNGLGEQPLYEISVCAIKGGIESDRTSRKIGLRDLKLIREKDEFGESFRFRVNGLDFFAKGVNWIPCDIFPSNIKDETYQHLVKSTAEANMNMIRVWGGGIFEDERFYDLCDQYGMLVWQDFMFACGTYPNFDDDFIKNVEQEAIDNVKRLQHRACLALWCGNNEIEQAFVNWKDNVWTSKQMPADQYSRVFDQLLPDVVAEFDGVTPYWPCSPHTPGSNRNDFNDPTIGDAHAWSVWFGGEPFEAQRNWTFRFMSEFGFQSFPEPETVKQFTAPEDRFLNSWVMDYHQRSDSGNSKIFRYLLDRFLPPSTLDHTLWMTQICQALCIEYAADHARRIQGRMDGLLYWQLNDIWPGATWSSIDVHGNWKALHFLARRFFEPVHLSILESVEKETVEFHVSNHLKQESNLIFRWEITDARGKHIRGGEESIVVPPQTNALAFDHSIADLRRNSPKLPLEIRNSPNAPRAADQDVLIWGWLEAEGQIISSNVSFLAKPKYLLLEKPTFDVSIVAFEGTEVELSLKSDRPSLWTHLALKGLKGRFSDNFLHLHPAHPQKIMLHLDEHTTSTILKDSLQVISIPERSIES